MEWRGIVTADGVGGRQPEYGVACSRQRFFRHSKSSELDLGGVIVAFFIGRDKTTVNFCRDTTTEKLCNTSGETKSASGL